MINTLEHKLLPAQIYSLRLWIKSINPDFLRPTFDKILSSTDFIVLNFSEYFFPIQGYTAIWLLAESHLAIHTFPQNGWSYIELSGCNESKTEHFKQIIENTNLVLKWDTNTVSMSLPV